jgi:hypothetical protein
MTLTVDPGVTVKFASVTSMFEISGTLNANGTSDQPITFTTNNASPAPGAWEGVYFGESVNSVMNHCIVEYAGWYFIQYPGIYIYSSSVVITNSTIRKNAYEGISIYDASPTISGCTVADNGGDGIWIRDYTVVYSNPIITGSTFTRNGGYGINNYTSSYVISATNNNWGDPSGPLDDSDDRATGGLYNPNGKGNKVSDNVNYYPWTGAAINQTATPTGLSGTPRYASINLTWNANSEPSLSGYKIYYGTTSNSYGTPIVTGNVTSYKLTGLSNNTPYYIAITSINKIGAESALTPEISAIPINKYTLDLTVTGTGKGSVLFGQGATVCNTNCSVPFDPSTAVILQGSAEEYSLFKGWSGDFAAANGDCKLTMDNDKVVTATFDKDTDHSVLITLPVQKYYPSLNAAYLDTYVPAVIKAWGT